MITNFEDITSDLTRKERDEILPVTVNLLSDKIGRKKVISQGKACDILNKKYGFKIRPERFRKIINTIRQYGYIENLASNSKGYYIATDKEDAFRNIQSIQDRINALEQLKKPLEEQYFKTWK